MKRYVYCIFAACIVLLCSCETLETVFKEPKLSIKAVDVTGIDFNGIELTCRVNVENPNSYDIPFPNIDWDILINTNSFVQGEIQTGDRIKARKTTTVDIPIRLTYTGLFSTFKSLSGAEEVAYAIALGVSFPIPLLESKVFNLDFEGSFPLPKMPEIAFKAFKIEKVNFSGLDLLFTVDIENKNSFAIPTPEINWQYAVLGIPFLMSSIKSDKNLAAKSTSSIDIGMHVSFTELLKSVASLKNKNEAAFAMSLGAAFAVPAFEGKEIDIEQLGSIPIPVMPKISFKGIKAKNIGLSSLDFTVSWEIENGNSFSLKLDQFDYDLSINASQWARGNIKENLVIAPNSTTEIPLDISIKSLQIVQEVTKLIMGGTSISYSSKGNLELSSDLPYFEKTSVPFNLSGSSKINR
ncbi:LEA type 2 family protein [Brucepastera parasyntrophica]|uniref:NDR1/HIN1-like protein n=1 Tax=Brucepastera parasyntrophica TaxID=2880008 RepID=UPI00210DDFE5|nr:LEA type 2 family protein [Brucepastera parasyntrophica]ULQ60499.1 LEA type 2 family protein [Brucepastera parasyntrophica]